jgi:aldose 1-epimerase
MRLSVTNMGLKALPFGLGFHPWFVRTSKTLLQAKAERVVLENSVHLPAGELPIEARWDWNFEAPRLLPGAWINIAFLGWDGHATITWPERRLCLEISADPPLSTYIVYSPSSDADHFCFEPVMHPVDAHNLPGGPQANG